ncbi:hypothetical protein PIB30_097194, partial [Stylosanthes scabra]|nr:hypothetical protein [Stylosanthes scabra]
DGNKDTLNAKDDSGSQQVQVQSVIDNNEEVFHFGSKKEKLSGFTENITNPDSKTAPDDQKNDGWIKVEKKGKSKQHSTDHRPIMKKQHLKKGIHYQGGSEVNNNKKITEKTKDLPSFSGSKSNTVDVTQLIMNCFSSTPIPVSARKRRRPVSLQPSPEAKEGVMKNSNLIPEEQKIQEFRVPNPTNDQSKASLPLEDPMNSKEVSGNPIPRSET